MPNLTIEILTGPPNTGKSTYAQQELRAAKADTLLPSEQASPITMIVHGLGHFANVVDDFHNGHFGNQDMRLIVDQEQLAGATVLVKEFIPNDNSRIDPDKLLVMLDDMATSDDAPLSVKGIAATMALSIRNGEFK